jgi:acetylornithine deacetylase/succinyl-diaminopimelate desuccinylase-like protein
LDSKKVINVNSIKNWLDVKSEAAEYLSHIIRINTSNPLKNEMDAIQYLVEVAEQNGLYTYVHKTDENRGNIVISLTPDYSNPIVLLSHLDVVPANEEDWEVPPFSGEIINDILWGRGTIDTKQLTITHLMVLILLKRNKVPLKREIIMIATSDEENGSQFGLLPFLEKHPTLFNNSLVFNEGGGFPLLIENQVYYLCELGQKGLAKVKITTKNKSSSNPYLPNNNGMQVILDTIKAFQEPKVYEKIPPATLALFTTIASSQEWHFSEYELELFLNKIPPNHLSLFKAMSKTTFSITKWNGGKKHPELKNQYEIYMDSRPVPSVNKETYEKLLETILGDLPVQYEILSFSQGYESEINHDHLALFEKELQTEVPNAKVVPFLSIGGSDSRHLTGFNSQIYGYCPMLPDMSFDRVIKMVHGVNERIPLESLRFGIQNMYNILVQMEGV